MAKNQQFKDSLKKFRRSIEEQINERALRIGNRVSKEIADTFAHNAKTRLLRGAEPLDENSRNLVQQIAESIYCKESTRSITYSKNSKKIEPTGYVVTIPKDKQGLTMFLEYGTGLEGENKPHPEASKIGWEYATQNGKKHPIETIFNGVKKIHNPKWYPTLYGKTGFVFRKQSNSYITQGDIIFQNKHKPYEVIERKNKDGSITQYVRQKPYKGIEKQVFGGDYVISSGIKPVRYIYDTKKEIRELLDDTKVYNVSFIRKLNKLKIK